MFGGGGGSEKQSEQSSSRLSSRDTPDLDPVEHLGDVKYALCRRQDGHTTSFFHNHQLVELGTWADDLGRLCTGERGICELRLDGVAVNTGEGGTTVDATTVKVQQPMPTRYSWAAVDASLLRKQVSIFFVPGSTTQSIPRSLFAPGYKSMTWVRPRTQIGIGTSPAGVINRNKMGMGGGNVIGRTSDV